MVSVIGYMNLQKGEKNPLKEPLCKLVSFITLIHSKVIFYFIHCFVVKAIKSDKSFCKSTTSFACTAERILIPAILFAFNATITFLQELFCYQIHQNKHAYGIKNNLHNFVKFTHKFVVILMLYFFNDPAKILILFSVFFTLFDLFVLHDRLPFYNLKMLKLSVACSTISAFCAIVTIYRFADTGENACLVMIPIIPLIVKMSLTKLNQTLKSIFALNTKTPFHLVHLPNLIDNYLQKHAIFPLPDKLSRPTLYSMGFLAPEIDRVIYTTQEQNLQVGTQETQKAAYSKAIEVMAKALQRSSNNELLSLNMAQIYFDVFNDSFKSLDLINKIADKKISFAARVSVQAISHSLESISKIQQTIPQIVNPNDKQEKRKNSHLSYFIYRHKTEILKKRIKLEIQDHLKLWKAFSSPDIDILTAITQASLISSHTRHTTGYWKKNFEGYEILYVNASLMYGLYLEIVQAIPSGGASFLKKAYSSINNKWHIYRDVIDVAVGTSAVIVASIEPDKIGKIIDASSSVKEMFKTTKQALLGTNIGVVIPNFVASRHNDYIRSYQKYFTGNIDHHISSYAKTLQDEYFKAEITLHISPLTHKGLNLVSYIKRVSENLSLIVVDPKGNIVEFSKDLSLPLNLYVKRGYLKIETLCPDFQRINQAFAVIYKSGSSSSENIDDAMTSKDPEETLLQSPKLMTPKGSNLESLMMPLNSPTQQRLLSSSAMENDFFKSFRSTERCLSNYDEPIVSKMTATEGTNNMTIEEAQEIWETYQHSKELKFYPFDKNTCKSTMQATKYETEIEPYLFDQKWYKIVKLKTVASSQKPTSHEIAPQYIPEEPISTVRDDFADVFPSEAERTDDEGEMTDSKGKPETLRSPIKNVKYTNRLTLSVDRKSVSNSDAFVKQANSDSQDPNHPGQIIMKKFSEKAQSRVTSQASHRMTAKRLNDSLKIEKQSASSKLVITMVYIAIIAIICSISIHLIYTKSSLTEMQSAISLTRLVNTRLSKTILNWQAMLILYSRAVKLRPIDYRIPLYQGVSIVASMDVLENAKDLAEAADNFQNKQIVSSLYAKTVAFWEPLEGTQFDDHAIDQFSANQILISYYLALARYTGSYLDLAGSREFLFTINNTANDYLFTLDRSIDDLSNFFDNTKSKNVSLISAITTMEILFILAPLVLIFIILGIVIKTYAKLFQAICKINDQSLAKRVKQLEDISSLFEGDIEEDVSSFHKFKSQGLTIKAISKKTAASTIYSRRYKLQNLIIYLLKYVFVAVVFTLVLITLVAISLHKSTDDLDTLSTINDKVLTIYQAGAPVRMLLPSWYVSIIFYNDTSYQIRENKPVSELADQLDGLDDVNNIFLSTLTDENNEISDPVIKDILNGDVCKYVTAANLNYCILATKGNSYGLLGMHSLYTTICQAMKDWVNAANPTFAVGVSLTALYSAQTNSMHLAIFDVYDYITDYLMDTFITTTEEDKNEMQSMFYQNIAAVLVAMFLIRVIVITKLQVFDLGIRRLLRIIPYRIIEENKVMSCYLARTFQDELKVLKQLA